MARWRLTEKHYLNVKGVEWEQIETLETGKQVRHRYPVPLYLDPKDDGIVIEWGQGWELIVSDGSNPGPRDIIFTGPPTPAMEPLDDEAGALTEIERPKWVHPIESLPGQGFNDSLLQTLSKQLAEALTNVKPQAPIIGVDPAEFAKMQQQLALLMARNAELESAKIERRA